MGQDTAAALKPGWYLLGPAFVAAIAYVDPGNAVAESDERNNTACAALRIVPALPAADSPVAAKGIGGVQP